MKKKNFSKGNPFGELMHIPLSLSGLYVWDKKIFVKAINALSNDLIDDIVYEIGKHIVENRSTDTYKEIHGKYILSKSEPLNWFLIFGITTYVIDSYFSTITKNATKIAKDNEVEFAFYSQGIKDGAAKFLNTWMEHYMSGQGILPCPFTKYEVESVA